MASKSVDVVVLGLGSGGERLATELAESGKSVIGLEPGRVGGECPYVACVPSKSLLHDAKRVAAGGGGGGGAGDTSVPSWADAVARRDELAHHREDDEHADGLVEAGVELIRSAGRLVDERTVETSDGTTITADHVVIATGADAVVPDIPGGDLDGLWTSSDALSSDERPERLVIVGGGPIGSELGQVYARFGSEVVLCEMSDSIHSAAEPEIAQALVETLEASGVTVHLGAELTSVTKLDSGRFRAKFDGADDLDGGVDGDRILLALGVAPNTSSFGLDAISGDGFDGSPDRFEVSLDGSVNGSDWLWAVGDVTGHSHWTHGATYQAKALADRLLGRAWNDPPTVMPSCVFTDPALATVGRTAEEARSEGHDVVVGWADHADTMRAATDQIERGRVAVVVDRVSGRFLGASLHGQRADDHVQIITAWMTAGVGIETAVRTVFPFPTLSQVVEHAVADAWSQLG